ncbi:MAG: carbonic anhydrase [Phycisphaerales bacterium]|nr:carbonic anhydrase [Phycisphaerales bacterium]
MAQRLNSRRLATLMVIACGLSAPLAVWAASPAHSEPTPAPSAKPAAPASKGTKENAAPSRGTTTLTTTGSESKSASKSSGSKSAPNANASGDEKASAKDGTNDQADAKDAKANKDTKESKDAKDAKPGAKTSKEAKPAPAAEFESPQNIDEIITMLTEGNQRWVDGAATAPNTSPERRSDVADAGQKPFVTVVTCADSRLPVERIFDRGIGDVFVVRVAGNVMGTSETGTVEYGVGHLKTPLLVVMGHSKCGAVQAAVTNAEVHGSVRALVKQIQPAVDRVKRNNPNADAKELMTLAIRENVWQSVFDLMKNSPEVRSMVAQGKLKVVGAVCDINSGKVQWLGEHPWQSELLDALAMRQNIGADEHAKATVPAAASKEHDANAMKPDTTPAAAGHASGEH